jgi:UDP-N-acetyl-D-glucosamine dehydrogenase
LGGHCIPIDPFYLTWLARKFGMSTRFIELAGEINTFMPRYVVGRIAEALNEHSKPVKGSRILILGVAYKKDIDDTREAPALELMDLLMEQGAIVSFHDPYVMTLPRTRRRPHLAGIARLELSPETVQSQDCVAIVTDHSDYSWNEIIGTARLVVDTRNVSAGIKGDRSHIYKA